MRIDHGETYELDDIFYYSTPVDLYNMIAPYGKIRFEKVRVEHDRVHGVINDVFVV